MRGNRNKDEEDDDDEMQNNKQMKGLKTLFISWGGVGVGGYVQRTFEHIRMINLVSWFKVCSDCQRCRKVFGFPGLGAVSESSIMNRGMRREVLNVPGSCKPERLMEVQYCEKLVVSTCRRFLLLKNLDLDQNRVEQKLKPDLLAMKPPHSPPPPPPHLHPVSRAELMEPQSSQTQR